MDEEVKSLILRLEKIEDIRKELRQEVKAIKKELRYKAQQ